jgi:hypothetical protein
MDSAGLYLMMAAKRIPGLTVRIQGLFPYARYMSFTLYSLRSTRVIDHVLDQSIVPDRGSTNPYRAMANRHARTRSYTLYIQPGPAPSSGPAPNTMYMGYYDAALVMYRVYAPDGGVNAYGNAPKPRIDLIERGKSRDKVTPLPMCATPKPVSAGSAVSALLAYFPVPLRWHFFGTSGIGTNVDLSYLDARLNRDDADEYVVRVKPPTFPDTYHGLSITGRENVRYWSICEYAAQSGAVVGCVHDYDAVRGRDGYVTIVLSTSANRPKTATRANGVNWLDFGTQPVGFLSYRQLLPSRSFQGSFLNVSPDAYAPEIQSTLGPYFPSIQTCSLADYAVTFCANQVQSCSDLTEPVPCSGSLNSHKEAASQLRRVGKLRT